MAIIIKDLTMERISNLYDGSEITTLEYELLIKNEFVKSYVEDEKYKRLKHLILMDDKEVDVIVIDKYTDKK
jgi:Tfp pilus assembly pilus retraction ATPase PilT